MPKKPVNKNTKKLALNILRADERFMRNFKGINSLNQRRAYFTRRMKKEINAISSMLNNGKNNGNNIENNILAKVPNNPENEAEFNSMFKPEVFRLEMLKIAERSRKQSEGKKGKTNISALGSIYNRYKGNNSIKNISKKTFVLNKLLGILQKHVPRDDDGKSMYTVTPEDIELVISKKFQDELYNS